jgi:RNA polymerase sigma-70 factor (ECF subfamily)
MDVSHRHKRRISFINQKPEKWNFIWKLAKQNYWQPKSDPYFDGDEVQIKLHKAIAALPKKQQLVLKWNILKS